MVDVTGFLSDTSAERLRGLIGRTLTAFGTELELDERVGAFSGWLQLGDEWVTVEFAEEVLDFPGFDSVEPVLTVHKPVTFDPGGEPHAVDAQITGITRIQECLTQFQRPSDGVEWRWWRDAGLRISLDDDRELVFHCPSTRAPEVHMRIGPDVLLPAPRKDMFQTGEKRRFEAERREVEL